MRVFIVEDEKPAAEKLRKAIEDSGPDTIVEGVSGSVKDAIAWLSSHPEPDLIMMDIELSDGLSLEIFKTVSLRCPVIFTTAYDEYFQQAFDHNGIDYLLKPVRKEKLHQALEKYKKLKAHFRQSRDTGMQSIVEILDHHAHRKERILVKKGGNFIPLNIKDAAYAYSEYKLTFIVAGDGERYMADQSLQDLEAIFHPGEWFRVSRKYLVSAASVKKFSSLGKGRLKLELTPPVNEDVIVSQENAAAFKSWIGGA